MNKPRRKRIQDIVQQLSELQANMESLMDDIDNILDEEAEYRDNIPENMLSSERYERADAACDALDSARNDLEGAKDSIDEVIQSLEEAAE